VEAFIIFKKTAKITPQSLKTIDEAEAQWLLDAKNGAVSQTAALNLQIGKAYITNANPEMAKRIINARKQASGHCLP
jgi:hypothetical protein